MAKRIRTKDKKQSRQLELMKKNLRVELPPSSFHKVEKQYKRIKGNWTEND